jgi:serine/threonine protein kinase
LRSKLPTTPPKKSGRNDSAPAPEAAPVVRTASSSELQPGEILNDLFKIVRFHARGGMGEIYEGVNINDESDHVAIKVLSRYSSSDPQLKKAFLAEGAKQRKLRALYHPAIVRNYFFAEDKSRNLLYIVMEYVQGTSLESALHTLNVGEAGAIKLIRRLAAGLEEVHALGYIHRDLSLDNILLPGGSLENAKIIDFGIAKDLDPSTGTVVGAGFAGKLGFAAPEQFGAFDPQIGPWTDVYSLGLVALAVAKGRPHPMGATLFEALEARRSPVDLSGVNRPLADVLEGMLASNPAERLRAMSAVLAKIDSASAAPTSPAKTIVDPERTRLSWIARDETSPPGEVRSTPPASATETETSWPSQAPETIWTSDRIDPGTSAPDAPPAQPLPTPEVDQETSANQDGPPSDTPDVDDRADTEIYFGGTLPGASREASVVVVADGSTVGESLPHQSRSPEAVPPETAPEGGQSANESALELTSNDGSNVGRDPAHLDHSPEAVPPEAAPEPSDGPSVDLGASPVDSVSAVPVELPIERLERAQTSEPVPQVAIPAAEGTIAPPVPAPAIVDPPAVPAERQAKRPATRHGIAPPVVGGALVAVLGAAAVIYYLGRSGPPTVTAMRAPATAPGPVAAGGVPSTNTASTDAHYALPPAQPTSPAAATSPPAQASQPAPSAAAPYIAPPTPARPPLSAPEARPPPPAIQPRPPANTANAKPQPIEVPSPAPPKPGPSRPPPSAQVPPQAIATAPPPSQPTERPQPVSTAQIEGTWCNSDIGLTVSSGRVAMDPHGGKGVPATYGVVGKDVSGDSAVVSVRNSGNNETYKLNFSHVGSNSMIWNYGGGSRVMHRCG